MYFLKNRTTGRKTGIWSPGNFMVLKIMFEHHYPLQSHLYLLALHRLLKWRLPNYAPEKHLGGYVYVFLRGIPSQEEIESQNYPQKIPGLIIENAPLKRIDSLDKVITRE